MATKLRKLQPTSEGIDEQTLLRDRAMRFTRQIVAFSDIDLETSKRNQARFLALHPETVELYTAAMNDGAVFPPIVVSGSKAPFSVLDGNHRIHSAIAAGFDSAEMLVVAGVTQAQRELFIYEANAKHGLPTSLEERIAQGVYLVGLGNQAVDVAQALSIPERKLWSAVGAKRSRQRMERLGSPVNPKWTESFYRRLGSIRSDVVVVPAAKLMLDTRMPIGEAEALITKINSHPSEGAALEFLAAESARLRATITSTAGGVLGLPKEINSLRIGLRMFRNLDAEKLAQGLAQVSPEYRTALGQETINGISQLMTLAAKFKQ